MNDGALKGLIALIPAGALFVGSAVMWLSTKSMSALLQLLGSGGLVIVVLSHVFEALRVFAWMRWGSKDSIGHYLDLLCAILGFTLFSVGYLIHAIKTRVRRNEQKA